MPTSKPPGRRGAQPKNQNARTHGLYSRISPSEQIKFLTVLSSTRIAARQPGIPPEDLELVLRGMSGQLRALLAAHPPGRPSSVFMDTLMAYKRLYDRVMRTLQARADFQKEAHSPLDNIRLSFQRRHITRDADSFFVPPEKSTLNSSDLNKSSLRNAKKRPEYSFSEFSKKSTLNLILPLETFLDPESPDLSHPFYSYTPLTDEQWAVIAPLIPPDPAIKHLHGEPPAIIAANRWRFVTEVPNPPAAQKALTEYRRLTPPSILTPPSLRTGGSCDHEPSRTGGSGNHKPSHTTSQRPSLPAPSRPLGRPATSPRPILDVIFWKLSSACPWNQSPPHYPSWRVCQRYYRRLFRSGRLYTILLALYDDLCHRSGTTPALLVEQGHLALDDRGHIILGTGGSCNHEPSLAPSQRSAPSVLSAPPDWALQTSLLLLQLSHAIVRAGQ